MQLGIDTEDLERIASLLGDVIPHISNSRIFITGGTGFFGKWFLETLVFLNDQHNVNCQAVVLTRNAQRFTSAYPLFAHPSITYVEGDVRDFEYPEGDFQYCIHAALEGENLSQTDELEVFNTAYQGTSHVLQFAKQKNVLSTLYISSGGVYGKQPADLPLMPETYNGAPDTMQLSTCYGEGKRVGEFLCTYYGLKYSMPVKIARCFAFAGPYLALNSHFVFGNFIGNCIAGEPLLIKGYGSTIRSYMYAGDLVVFLFKTLIHGDALAPYNIGSDIPVSVLELAERIAAHFPAHKGITVLQQKQKDKMPDRYIPDISRLHAKFPIEHLGLDDTISRTIRYYKRTLDIL